MAPLSTPGALALVWRDEPIELLAERALYLRAHRTLLVADAHIGKAASFRRLGVPVPEATTDGTLARLTAALARTGAEQLVFLGDLLHARAAREGAPAESFARWRADHATLHCLLVRGNHERHAGAPPAAWRVHGVEGSHRLGPWRLTHALDDEGLPEPNATVHPPYAFAGHEHPCVHLSGRAHERLRLPCFHFRAHGAVLPAFGAFTGMHRVRPAAGERVFVVREQAVAEWRGWG